MTTSGSTNYTVDRNTLIKESMQLIGALGEGVDPNATQYADASRALNIMVKAWQAHGLQLWTISTASITLTASTASYILGPAGSTGLIERPLKIVEAYIRNTDDTDLVMQPLTRQQYVNIPNKSQTGLPTQWFYDPQLTNGTVYVYPAPDATSATYTLKLVYQSPIEDMDSSTDDFDFPKEWYEAIKYGLAVRLAPVYGLPYNDRLMLKRDYEEIMSLAMSWDTEQESVFFAIAGK